MASNEDIALMAHLMRRAGFGATRDELETRVAQGYEETVEDLLDVDRYSPVDEFEFYRHYPIAETAGATGDLCQTHWLYHMLRTKRPLEEKVALFWHQVFATGANKVDNTEEMISQINMLREHGLGNYRDLLIRLAKDPAMIFWLDNNDNHKRAVNENWGRELLELFSLGVGNYTETDVYECSRAFTGWTLESKPPRFPQSRYPWYFEYRREDHDDGEKTFLGETGRFNGEDIIDIIVQQPACHRFIARHLYNFFVADEPQVPAWPDEPPGDREAVRILAEAFVSSNFEMKPVLRMLFNSEFFKSEAVRFQKVRSPVEVVAGTLELVEEFPGHHPDFALMILAPRRMGQDFVNPPSVEGWHTGKEWINSGALVERVNFVSGRLGNVDLPGVQKIVNRVASNGGSMGAEDLVGRCLDLLGPLEVEEQTHKDLVEQAAEEGPLAWSTDDEYADFSRRVGEVLALIAATREYQFG